MNNLTYIYGYTKDNRKKVLIISNKSTGIIKEIIYNPVDINEALKKSQDYKDITLYSLNSNEYISAGDFNAHSHPEQSLYKSIALKTWDLPTWCKNTIYKYSTVLKPEDIYKGSREAFLSMLKYGVTSTMASFYCHKNSGNLYDKEVIKAASDTGIRLYFGRMNYDIINENAYREKMDSQKTYFEKPEEAKNNYIELLKEYNSPTIEIAPSIHSIHASSKEAIINAINLGNAYDKFVQFHLSEDEGDVNLSLKLYGLRPVNFLVSLLKDGYIKSLEHLILSDCIWVNDEEISLIKEYNIKVTLNPRMNAHIKAGEAPLSKMLKAGIIPYLGTDGEASNDDLSITGELNFLKQKYKGSIPDLDLEKLNSLPFRFKKGYITNKLKSGAFCDLKIIEDGHVAHVFVGGNLIY